MFLETHDFFANLSWILLNIILLSRPLAVITKNIYLLKLLRFRRELGVACGLSALVHVGFFLLGSGLGAHIFSDSRFWSLNSFFGWGTLATVLMLAPLLTSNNYSIRFFKKYWKKIQQITYGVYLVTAVHIALISEDLVVMLFPVLVWIIVWVWANHVVKKKI